MQYIVLLSILLSDLIVYEIKTLKIFILKQSNYAIEFAAKYKQSILFKNKSFWKNKLYGVFESEITVQCKQECAKK